MKISQILTEHVWEDLYTAGQAVKRYPNKWIHFSNINKIGINPKKSHHDPHGIYFYPCKWLLSEDHSIYGGYGTSMDYYFICDIDTSNCINLGNMTTKKAENIAKQNGWYDSYRKVVDENLFQYMRKVPSKNNLRKPGGMFYSVMDFLVNQNDFSDIPQYTWGQLLKGIDGLYDPGYGIIASQEPAQLVVFKRSLIKIIESGQNLNITNSLLNGYLKAITEKHNGTVEFKNKIMISKMTIDGKPIEISMDTNSFYGFVISSYQNGLWVNKAIKMTPIEDFTERRMEYEISKVVETASTDGTKPLLSLNDVKKLTNDLFSYASMVRSGMSNTGEIFYIIDMHRSLFFKILSDDKTATVDVSFGSPQEGDMKEFSKTYTVSDIKNIEDDVRRWIKSDVPFIKRMLKT